MRVGKSEWSIVLLGEKAKKLHEDNDRKDVIGSITAKNGFRRVIFEE